MTDRTRVNFHCHSDISDGAHPPEALAAILAHDGVRYAALTDHDSIDGLVRFGEAMREHGLGCIPGVEITARRRSDEVHLLAYGFDPANPALRGTLFDIRKQRRLGPQLLLASLRASLGKKASSPTEDEETSPPLPRHLPPFDCAEIIRRVHEAGGLVFLAHPLILSSDFDEVTGIVRELKTQGLDGLEAYYADYSPQEREQLAALAKAEGLLTSGGTDLHATASRSALLPGIEIPTRAWKAFRDALREASSSSSRRTVDPSPRRTSPLRWKQLAVRIALPAVLTIAFFLFMCFVVLIPLMEERLMERKRETARELTAAASSLLEEFAVEEQRGVMSREEAQRQAIERIRNLHYGPQRKDYFWIIDMHPTMLMHPYRTDLEGTDLSGFTDAEGHRLFIESVEEVRDDGEGYIYYLWQWQDDPHRVEPKLSHVRRFEPWDWIIGTGIYIEDVQREISAVTRHVMWSAVWITLFVVALLAYIVRESVRLERQRSRAEAALRDSHEQYRLLVETAAEGTMLLVDGKCVFANRAMLELLDYAPEDVALLEWHDLLPEDPPADQPTVRHLTDLIEGRPAPLEHVGRLRHKDGRPVPVTISCQSIQIADRRGLILSARDLRGSDPRERPTDRDQKAQLEDLQSSLLFLNESVAHFRRAAPRCRLDTPIREVAGHMVRDDASAVLIESERGLPVGIVTDGDLRRRVVANDHDAARPVFEIMSSPIVGVSEESLTYEALLKMKEGGVRHLALRDVRGQISGIVRDADLVAFDRYAAAVIVRQIERAESLEALIAARDRAPQIAGSLIDVSASPRAVVRLLTSICDAATDRLVRMAMDELGPPPTRFAFIAMGSQGREEQTLYTDQDNGILYEDVAPKRRESVQRYFLALGDRVCQGLDAAGYRFCEGGVMARNPEWCGPLAAWQERFDGWIAASEPKDILHFDMCFDFRCVYGADELAHRLRCFAFERMGLRPEFLAHFANNTLLYRPPLGFFGKIMVRPHGEHEKVLDLKDATMPIVKFARIYALRDRLPQIGTLERLDRMASLNLLSQKGHDDAVLAYRFLSSLRLRHQIEAIRAGRTPDNHIAPKTLTHIEGVTLRESLGQIAILQKRLAYDFLGAAEV